MRDLKKEIEETRQQTELIKKGGYSHGSKKGEHDHGHHGGGTRGGRGGGGNKR